jgi:hypothetical protein
MECEVLDGHIGIFPMPEEHLDKPAFHGLACFCDEKSDEHFPESRKMRFIKVP